MVCKITAEEDQTEFEFLSQVRNSPEAQCCGPLVFVGFTDAALSEVLTALVHSGETFDVLDSYEGSVLESSHLGFKMCSKHWFEISQKIGTTATREDNRIWAQLSFYIFRVLCLSNAWDYKEVMNYMMHY